MNVSGYQVKLPEWMGIVELVISLALCPRSLNGSAHCVDGLFAIACIFPIRNYSIVTMPYLL